MESRPNNSKVRANAKANPVYKNKFKNPTHLYVSESLGEEPVAVPTKVFADKAGIIWCESNVVEGKHHSMLQVDSHPHNMSESMLQAIYYQIEENRDKLAIIYMGEKVGYGVFARQDISANTYVATYCGLMIPVSNEFPPESHSNPYAVGINNDGKMTGTINSEYYRNMGAFFQHVPASDEDYVSANDHNVKFATENLVTMMFYYKGFPVMLLKTNRSVMKGEMLGWDYGKIYWLNHHAVPCLFTPKGEIIPSEACLTNKIILRIEKDSRKMDMALAMGEIMKNFKNDGTMKFQAEEHEILVITQDDFMEKYSKNPTAPYVIMKPSYTIPVSPADNEEAEKENQVEMEVPVHGSKDESVKPNAVSDKAGASKADDASEFSGMKKTFDQISSGLKFGFQSQSKAEAVCAQLNRICSDFGLPKWNYNEKKDIAYIGSSNAESLKTICKYLESNGMRVQYGLFPVTKQPTVYLYNPKLDALKAIPSPASMDKNQLNIH